MDGRCSAQHPGSNGGKPVSGAAVARHPCARRVSPDGVPKLKRKRRVHAMLELVDFENCVSDTMHVHLCAYNASG
jgi:hypothetical protein